MKKEEEKIDELIKEALSSEEAKFYDALGEQSLIEKVSKVYQGKIGWLASVMTAVNIGVFIIFIFCITQFVKTTDTVGLITWASASFICLIVMVMLKLYVWMQMDKNDILRELKRLELQVYAVAQQQQNRTT
jgi:hypothetical protein